VNIATRALAGALAMLFAVPSMAQAAGPVGHFRVAIDTNAQSAAYAPARDDVVILQQYQAARVPQLKAANPGLKVLMYKNLSGMTERTSSGFVSGGVATQDAAAHPEWFLLNTSGQRFTSRYFGWVWIADVGSASYQRQWADNVLGEIAAGGWDGVFMDDTNPTMSWHYDVNRIAKYPTDAAWQAATRSALVSIGSRFRSAGKLVIPNFSNQKSFPTVIKDWMGLVDGGLNEQFLKWGTTQNGPETYDPTDYWELQLRQMKEAEAAGKYYLGITPSTATDRAAARYGFATMLLAGGGKLHFALHDDYTNERWFEEYDYAIGAPAGAESKDASGIHKRVFANGLVYVNPTASAVRVDFGGAYTGSGLQGATSTTLQPRSGLVLAKAGEGSPFRPPRPARTDRTKKTKVTATTSRKTGAKAKSRAKAKARPKTKARKKARNRKHRSARSARS
jgi:putative glycosyl hydrolase-like family 15 (GHL15) protein